jgi:transcriptional regulator with XRE-family HTH domain
VLRVEYERRKQGIPQKELARRAGLHQPTISLIEQGRLQPTEAELAALARALGLNPPAVLMRPVLVDPAGETFVENDAPTSSESPAMEPTR